MIRPRNNKPSLFPDPNDPLIGFVLDGLQELDIEDRQEIFEAIRAVYCMFCGRRHPTGAMCQCWDEATL